MPRGAGFVSCYGTRTEPGADAEAALRLSPTGEEYWGLGPLAALAAADGDTAQSRHLMAQAVAPFARRPFGAVPAWVLVPGLAASGQRQLALDWLERAHPRGALLWWVMQFPEMDALRDDPRFQRVLGESWPPGMR